LRLLLDEKEAFEALVLDVMLPGKDGFAVARELREAQNFIPFVDAYRAQPPEDVLRGFESGADDYLSKPFNLAILLLACRACCAARTGRTPAPPLEPAVSEPEYRKSSNSTTKRRIFSGCNCGVAHRCSK
jgi:DNA-binding response OmpR family regulator